MKRHPTRFVQQTCTDIAWLPEEGAITFLSNQICVFGLECLGQDCEKIFGKSSSCSLQQ